MSSLGTALKPTGDGDPRPPPLLDRRSDPPTPRSRTLPGPHGVGERQPGASGRGLRRTNAPVSRAANRIRRGRRQRSTPIRGRAHTRPPTVWASRPWLEARRPAPSARRGPLQLATVARAPPPGPPRCSLRFGEHSAGAVSAFPAAEYPMLERIAVPRAAHFSVLRPLSSCSALARSRRFLSRRSPSFSAWLPAPAACSRAAKASGSSPGDDEVFVAGSYHRFWASFSGSRSLRTFSWRGRRNHEHREPRAHRPGAAA